MTYDLIFCTGRDKFRILILKIAKFGRIVKFLNFKLFTLNDDLLNTLSDKTMS